MCDVKAIKQKKDYTCGPVAIRNACWVIGMKIPSVNKLTWICGTDIEGTSISGLRSGAKYAGLNLKRIYMLYRVNIDSLTLLSTQTPLILGYTVAGEGHYCVIVRKNHFTNEIGWTSKFVALNWNHDLVVAFGSHSDLLTESVVTSEWLIGKLLARGTEIYLVSKEKNK